MKIFISWSGQLGEQVAEIWRDWLPLVLQSANPYMSAQDIDKGVRWSVDISRQLEESDYGIICVTGDNVNAPWLNFEAGALSKSFDKGRVSPFLFDLAPSALTGPMVQFQATVWEKDDVLKLVKSINSASDSPLVELLLSRSFEAWWPELNNKFTGLQQRPAESGEPATTRRPIEEMVSELLDLSRTQQKTLYSLDSRIGIRPSGSTYDLEKLEKLIERLIREDRLEIREVYDAFPDVPSKKVRNWMMSLNRYHFPPSFRSENPEQESENPGEED